MALKINSNKHTEEISENETTIEKSKIDSSKLEKEIDDLENSKKSFKKTKLSSAILAGVITAAITIPATYFISKNHWSNKEEVKTAVEKVGKIIAEETQGDVKGFLIESNNGQKQIVFATKGGEHLIVGDGFTRESGEPAFKVLIDKVLSSMSPEEQQAIQNGGQVQSAPVLTGKNATVHPHQNGGQAKAVWDKAPAETPAVIDYLDALGGYKENNNVDKHSTVYVFFDPSCPACHNYYSKTRFIENRKDVTIKWIPTLARGETNPASETYKKAAASLSILKNSNDLASMFGNAISPVMVDKVTEEHTNELNKNLGAMFAAADQAYGEGASVGVPAIIYMDKTDGSVRMTFGGGDADDLLMLYGK